MSLFPAYAPDPEGEKADEVNETRNRWDVDAEAEGARAPAAGGGCSPASPPLPAALEASLLASDSGGEDAPPPRPAPPSEHFYLDAKADNANLGVTTLYYPGRPIYKCASKHALGAARARGGGGAGAGARRYYRAPPAPPPPGGEVSARRAAYRAMLADAPHDEELWLRYIYFQEEWGSAREWLEACEAAAAAARGRGGACGRGGARVRSQLHRARAAALPHRADLLDLLSKDIHAERRERVRLEQWVRLARTLGAAGDADAGRDVQRAAEAALADLAHYPPAYPHLLHAYGAWLRAAGLWEQLVLLVELVCAMNFPPAPGFPPPPHVDPPAAERRLQALEDEVINSGLPVSTVWVRVERLRAAAHWRPAAGGEEDPQRAPSAHDVQALVRAVPPQAQLLACCAALRLAQVPPLPASCAARAALACEADEDAGAGAALLALARAARRVPRASPAATGAPPHAARAHALCRTLATVLDPPHYFTDEHGYLRWVRALWEACCGWAAGARRLALACWRLRWLHALARLSSPAERRRLRLEARALLAAHAPRAPAAFALFARLEHACGDTEAAARVATQAVRASAGDASVPREHALFAARVLREVGGRGGGARWAACCAALGRALPPAAELAGPPPAALEQQALDTCSERCRELEAGFWKAEAGDATDADADAARALTCGGAGEWGGARVALLAPAARARELERLLALPHEHVHQSVESLQYYEACACACAVHSGLEGAARRLLPLFPHNALIATACSGGAAWRAGAGVGAGSVRAAARSHTAALARALPPLLRAPLHHDSTPEEMERLSRALSRAGAGGEGGAALWTLRLEAAARAARHDARRVLLAALAHCPNHKWLLVRGAAWARGEAAALCDAALERGLRVHALPDELRALPAPSPPEPAACPGH